MADPAGDGGWSEFHKRFAVQGLPQIPDKAVVRRYAALIGRHDRRVLLLGITRALAEIGRDLTAVDFSAAQIESMWPGDARDRRALLGDWRELEPAREPFTAAIGDGSLSTLAWPGDHREVLARVAGRARSPGGILVVRCFAPDRRRPLELVVADVLEGRERDCNAARWRIAMAVAERPGGIAARDLAAVWQRSFPDLAALAARTGWSLDGMNLIFDSFSRSPVRFSFVTRAALLDTLPPSPPPARASRRRATIRCPSAARSSSRSAPVDAVAARFGAERRRGLEWPPLVEDPAATLLALARQLEASQWLDPDMHRARQFAQLGRIAPWLAARSPAFAERLREAGLAADALASPKAWLPCRQSTGAGSRTRPRSPAMPCRRGTSRSVRTSPRARPANSSACGARACSQLVWLAMVLRDHAWRGTDFNVRSSPRVRRARESGITPTGARRRARCSRPGPR